jgi:hypothetical protein
MTASSEAAGGHESTGAEGFLLAEYQGLIDIDRSRNERLDRFLTLFLTLAASPWAVYTLVLKEGASPQAFDSIPLVVAWVFLLTGLLGFLVTMMFIQVRFSIILYTRAMNAVRGHFAGMGNIRAALRLPTRGDVPPYYEKGSYILVAVLGMAVVNAAYLGFGAYRVTAPALSSLVRASSCLLLSVCWGTAHLYYYHRQAWQRDHRDSKAAGGLSFGPAARQPRRHD